MSCVAATADGVFPQQAAPLTDLPTGAGAAAANSSPSAAANSVGLAALDHGLAGDHGASDASGE